MQMLNLPSKIFPVNNQAFDFMGKMSFHPLIMVAIFLHIFMARFGMSAPNLTTDEAALLQLKAHISLDTHSFFSHNWNWSASASICNWVGVTCGIRHGRVTAINLPEMGFGGTIPPHVGNLSFLVSLNITGNSFYGTFPDELLHLRRLRAIDLSFNSFSGSIPSNMCNHLTQLESFDAASNEITGQLPLNLGDCRKLKRLSFSVNKITGRIPPSIGNLTELMILNLGDNNLEGDFPASIFNISSLKRLVVANNSLSGSLPHDFCPRHQSIEVLVFLNNKITGTIPKSIGNCTSLNVLILAENQLTGEIPHEIGSIYNLKRLFLNSNYLIGLIPSTIFNNSNIGVINLNDNHLSGHLPSSLGLYLPNLLGLCLGKNNLSGIIPSSICNASKVTMLELSRNSFRGLIPNTFGNCIQLQILDLAFNNLTVGSSTQRQSIYSSLTNCGHLRQLIMSANPLKGVLPNSIGNLSKSLEGFHAGSGELCGGIPVEIGNLSNLFILFLPDNELAGTIPKTLGKLNKLQGLFFSSNKLQGSVPNDLCELDSMYILLLDSNALQGRIPSCFANLSSLRFLNLSTNRLSSSIPPSFWNLSYILGVDFSLNSISGSLPTDIENMKVLRDFYLSENQLSGYLPSSIGRLQDLANLTLSRNGFQGHIPQSFGSLISLESLDLSANNLSGEIPKSLEALSHLNYFNVSFNELEGEIPSGGPFVNFTVESFTQNRALCGPSRLHVPPCKTISKHKSKAAKFILRYILPAIAKIMVVLALTIILIRRRKRNKCLSMENDSLNLETIRRISYHELQQATNGFNASNLLGTGSFGSVYKATLTDGMNVAIKVINLQEDRVAKSFDVECEVMHRIRHRNLVKIISSCNNFDFKALILQYMPQGSLQNWLYSYNYFLNIRQRLNIMIDVASALEYLHYGSSTPVIHCDLKPNNVLLDEDMVAHLGDFGIAQLVDGADSVTQTMTLATIGYMAPEYGLDGVVSTRGDVYSFGILLIETFTRKKPTDNMFEGEMSLKRWVEESLPDALSEIVDASLLSREEEEEEENDFAAKKVCISSIMSLALKCSADNPEERINVKDALVALKKIKTKLLKDVQQA